MDSPPNKSLGRNEFKFDGVPFGSLQSRGGADQGLAEDELFGHPIFQVSVGVCLVEPRQLPDEPFC